jgi:hypothetical protein
MLVFVAVAILPDFVVVLLVLGIAGGAAVSVWFRGS